MSDDGASALVLIAMLGNVFSPRWAAARARGPARSLDFCAVNVALHGPGRTWWAMTEHAPGAVVRAADELAIGRTTLAWEHGALVARIDERTSPFGRPLRGTVRFHPEAEPAAPVPLDDDARHLWQPVSPRGRIEATFEDPSLVFRGHGYLDHNRGDEPLEEGFDAWTWSRAGSDDDLTVAYDVTLRDGSVRSRGVRIEGDRVTTLPSDELRDAMPTTRFGLAREIRRHGGAPLRHVRTLEDGPFYARSLVRTEAGDAVGVHEAVSLRRFRQRWVQFLVPFRMRVDGARR